MQAELVVEKYLQYYFKKTEKKNIYNEMWDTRKYRDVTMCIFCVRMLVYVFVT